jgi:hypothetical protein
MTGFKRNKSDEMHYGTYFALIANVEDPVRNYLRKLCVNPSSTLHRHPIHQKYITNTVFNDTVH